MPKVKREKEFQVHPNSRRASQIARENCKTNKRLNKVQNRATKLDVQNKKLLWFKEQLNSDLENCDISKFSQIMVKFLSRFDEELRHIASIRGRRHRVPSQHFARERAITFTKEHEAMLLKSTGLDVPDLLNEDTVRNLRLWDGDPKGVPKFPLIKFTQKMFHFNDATPT